tara:strand:- start:1375 stop:1554 length:180 start_codon:yes stop_codon:yes gene_type:complete
MRTQNKENYYYIFWVVAMVAFIVPQVFTAIAYMKLAEIIEEPIKVQLVNEAKLKVKVGL